jgi:hypothetical protein
MISGISPLDHHPGLKSLVPHSSAHSSSVPSSIINLCKHPSHLCSQQLAAPMGRETSRGSRVLGVSVYAWQLFHLLSMYPFYQLSFKTQTRSAQTPHSTAREKHKLSLPPVSQDFLNFLEVCLFLITSVSHFIFTKFVDLSHTTFDGVVCHFLGNKN